MINENQPEALSSLSVIYIGSKMVPQSTLQRIHHKPLIYTDLQENSRTRTAFNCIVLTELKY